MARNTNSTIEGRILLASMAVLICSMGSFSTAAAEPFPGLERLKHDSTTVAYHRDKAEVILGKDKKILDYSPLLLLESPLGGGKLVVTQRETGSDYIMLEITKPEEGKKWGEGTTVGQLEMGRGGDVFFPGGRSIYTRVDGVSRKFRFATKDKIEEVVQPFLYLGKQTKVALPEDTMCGAYKGPKTLQLRAKKSEKSSVVATLKVGTEIEVVLREGDWFLIKTPFGLTGWAKPTGYFSLFGFADSCVG